MPLRAIRSDASSSEPDQRLEAGNTKSRRTAEETIEEWLEGDDVQQHVEVMKCETLFAHAAVDHHLTTEHEALDEISQ